MFNIWYNIYYIYFSYVFKQVGRLKSPGAAIFVSVSSDLGTDAHGFTEAGGAHGQNHKLLQQEAAAPTEANAVSCRPNLFRNLEKNL